MHYCNICGSGDAYEGLNVVECINQDCKNFTQKQFDAVMALKKKSDVTIKDAEKNLQKFKEAYGYPIPPINEEVKPNDQTFKNEYYSEPDIMDKNPILWLDVDKIEFIPPDTTNISQYNIDNTKLRMYYPTG